MYGSDGPGGDSGGPGGGSGDPGVVLVVLGGSRLSFLIKRFLIKGHRMYSSKAMEAPTLLPPRPQQLTPQGTM